MSRRTTLAAALLVAACIVLGFPQLAQAQARDGDDDVDCSSQQSQMALNVCSGREAEAADAELNEVWSALRVKTKAFDKEAQIPPEESVSAQLLKAQRAWIDYRDGQCSAEAAQYYGGSIRPLIGNTCATRMTQARTQELRTMLEDNR